MSNQIPDWFMEFMAQVSERYPTWAAKPGTAHAYWVSLGHIPPRDLLRALLQHAASNRFAPAICDLRSLAALPEALRLTPAEAWDEMYRNRRKRTFRAPKWTNEAVRRAAEVVRWDDPDWQTEQIPTIRAQFERYYTSLADKRDAIDAAQEAVALLPGMSALMAKMDAKRIT